MSRRRVRVQDCVYEPRLCGASLAFVLHIWYSRSALDCSSSLLHQRSPPRKADGQPAITSQASSQGARFRNRFLSLPRPSNSGDRVNNFLRTMMLSGMLTLLASIGCFKHSHHRPRRIAKPDLFFDPRFSRDMPLCCNVFCKADAVVPFLFGLLCLTAFESIQTRLGVGSISASASLHVRACLRTCVQALSLPLSWSMRSWPYPQHRKDGCQKWSGWLCFPSAPIN